MTLADDARIRSYADSFWVPDLDSTEGTNALLKRNIESKRMCQDLEKYFRERAKLESEYCKSLSGLTKCFRERDDIGVLEASISTLRGELETMARAHMHASEQFQSHAEGMKRFREEQGTFRKLVEETLLKAQSAKISNLTKTLQAQKTYVKKSLERDAAELACKEREMIQATPAKDLEKFKHKAMKLEEEADKVDSAYRGSVMVLEQSRDHWEKQMVVACRSIQDLDEKQIKELRKDLWLAINVDSRLALAIDDRCEAVREVLEKCDVTTDIQAVIQSIGTCSAKPDKFEFTHYSKLAPSPDQDSAFHVYSEVDGVTAAGVGDVSSNNPRSLMSSALGMGKALRKKLASTD